MSSKVRTMTGRSQFAMRRQSIARTMLRSAMQYTGTALEKTSYSTLTQIIAGITSVTKGLMRPLCFEVQIRRACVLVRDSCLTLAHLAYFDDSRLSRSLRKPVWGDGQSETEHRDPPCCVQRLEGLIRRSRYQSSLLPHLP